MEASGEIGENFLLAKIPAIQYIMTYSNYFGSYSAIQTLVCLVEGQIQSVNLIE